MTFRFRIDESQVVAFERSLGMSSSEGTEAGRERRVVPTTFLASDVVFDPDYKLRPRMGEPWMGSARSPSGVPEDELPARGLHAEQRFQFRREPRVGDVLSATRRSGRRWTKEGRSGTLVFSELITDYTDDSGQLVATATAVTAAIGHDAETNKDELE